MKYATQHWPPEYKNVFTVDLDIVVKSKWGKDKWLETNLSVYYSDKVFVRTTIDEINLLMSDNGSVVLSKEEITSNSNIRIQFYELLQRHTIWRKSRRG